MTDTPSPTLGLAFPLFKLLIALLKERTQELFNFAGHFFSYLQDGKTAPLDILHSTFKIPSNNIYGYMKTTHDGSTLQRVSEHTSIAFYKYEMI